MPETGNLPSNFKLNKSNLIKVGIAILIAAVIAGAVFAFKPKSTPTDSSATDQNKLGNENTQTPTPSQTQTSNNENEIAFLPANTCPDKMDFSSGQAKATLNGKSYFLRGEDITWVDKNCKSNSNNGSNSSSKDLNSQFSAGQCQGDKPVQFTQSPLALNDLLYIVPMGRMFDSHVTPTDHQYWQPKNKNAAWTTYSVVAPADGYIVAVGKFGANSNNTLDNATKVNGGDDFHVTLEHSCMTYSIFIHMHSINNKFMSQVKLDSNNRTSPEFRVAIKKGEEIGKVGGDTFDLTVVDGTKKLAGHVNLDHYSESWRPYVINPFDNFESSIKTQLEAKTPRSIAPIGGKIDYDIDGKLVGNWFRQGSNWYAGNSSDHRYWDGHLSIAYDQFDPTGIMVSTGNFNGKSAQFAVKGNTPDPKNIDANSGIVKYELMSYYHSDNGSRWNMSTVSKNLKLTVETGGSKGVALFQVQPDKTLKVEFFPGKTPSQVSAFTANAKVYMR